MTIRQGDATRARVNRLQINHQPDEAVEVSWRGRAILRYSYRHTNHPHWHPVRVPDGRCVSLAQPHDHVWHSGLYHCPKFVDQVSLWEPELHMARAASGGTLPLDPDHHGSGAFGWLETTAIQLHQEAPDSISIEAESRWRSAMGEILGHERQHWIVHEPQDDCRAYLIRLELELAAEGQDRWIWAGTHGYSGLSWRSPRAMDRGTIINDHGESLGLAPRTGPAHWVDYTGAVDGHGYDLLSGEAVGAMRHDDPNRWCGVALFSHPDNPQSSFFTLGQFGFLAAHVGYPERLRLSIGAPLRLRYGVLVHAWPGSVERVEPFYLAFLRACS